MPVYEVSRRYEVCIMTYEVLMRLRLRRELCIMTYAAAYEVCIMTYEVLMR